MSYQGNQFESRLKVISDDYTIVETDYYIGVNSIEAVTITLPEGFPDNTKIIIKLEMGLPLNGRTVTLVTEDYSSIVNTSIDGDSLYVLDKSYQSVTILCRGGHWFII